MNVTYCRVAQPSWEKIEKQKIVCINFLENKGIKSDEIFADDGFSGLNTDRPSFNNMINKLDNIKSITVASTDRIYRDMAKLIEFLQILRDKGIKLYDASKGIDIVENHDCFKII
jgi:site-specific DNA recombinase